MKQKWTNTRWLIVVILIWAFSFPLTAQQRNLTGRVTEFRTGETIPGATILVQGTQRGTTTNAHGYFSLQVSEGDALVISVIGLLTETIIIEGQNHIEVQMMPDISSLQEVVVIGYGQVRKGDATGAVSTVSSKDFNKGAITTPQELLAGRVSGVQVTTAGGAPGSGATIRIRGGSSLSASNEPLIVIDGVPVDNDGVSGMRNPLSAINPNDIESFTVLKDASATAIYGSRASNGVIIITTKGGIRDRTRFSYNSNFSLGVKTNQIDVFDAAQYRDIIINRYGENSAAASLLGDSKTNWQDEIFRNALGTDHNFSMAGASMNIPYRVSVGYSGQSGLLMTSNMQRYTGSLNANPSFLNDHLRVNLSILGVYNENRFASTSAIGNAILYDPTKPVHDDNSPFGGYTTWMDANRPASFAPSNPVALLSQTRDISDVMRSIGSLKLDYKLPFMPKLQATLNLGYDFSASNGSVFISEDAAFEYRTASDGTNISGEDRVYNQGKRNQLVDFYLNYNNELPSIKSRLDAMAGYSWQYFWREDFWKATSVNKQYIIAPERTVPTENYLISFFGRVNYSFMDKYLLTFTLRQDGTSRFSPENRWGTFPSVAVAWRIVEESFLKNSKVVSNLRLRLGYGITGQQYITSDNYPYLARYSFSQPTARYQFGDRWVTMARPAGYDINLKWEETTTFNIGIDYGFFNERIHGSVELYQRETRDLINEIPVAAGSNFTNILLTNVGNLENRGVEFNINLIPVASRQRFWEIGLNFTRNINKITKLTAIDNPAYQGAFTGIISGGTGNYAQINSVGFPANSFFVFQQAYDPGGKPLNGVYVDRNGDGEITIEDRYHFYSSAPDYMIGLSSRAEYGKWDLAFSGRANIGNFVYNDFAASNANYQFTYNPPFIQNLPASIRNTEFASQQLLSDYYVREASFLRMDFISLGYRIGGIMHQNTSLRLSFTVQNPFVITSYEGLDPEVFNGMDINIYPRPVNFILGLSFEF
jgi:TonB-linked SusC/RagA family outer membrane protein